MTENTFKKLFIFELVYDMCIWITKKEKCINICRNVLKMLYS